MKLYVVELFKVIFCRVYILSTGELLRIFGILMILLLFHDSSFQFESIFIVIF